LARGKREPAVFLDRDFTIIEDTEYSTDVARLAPLPGVVEALKELKRSGYRLVIVTNQSGVARGTFTEEALRDFHRRMLDMFAGLGVSFDGLYYCPHFTEGEAKQYVRECDCRKPAPGLLLRAAEELGLDLERSWMVGDRPSDVGAGHAAGCRTIRVLTGHQPEPGDPEPDATVPDLAAAVRYILAADRP